MRKLVIVVWCLVGIALGCSQAVRLRLEAFFFEIPEAGATQPDTAASLVSAEPLPTLTLPGPRFRSFHPPYVLRQCTDCHDSSSRMQVRDDFPDQCRSCHARYYGDEVGHPPVAEGECRTCHVLHRSVHPRLLTLSVFETCIECHDEPEDLSEEAHGGEDGGEEIRNCIACHDPHFGTSPLLRP